jgi:ribonuclease PH
MCFLHAFLANGATQIHGRVPTAATVALSDIGFPLSGSMSMGFAVGFMKDVRNIHTIFLREQVKGQSKGIMEG